VRATAAAAAGAAALGAAGFLLVGGGAQAVARGVNETIDGRLAAMGFRLKAVHVQGASAEAVPAIRASLLLYRGQPLARLDLDAVKARVEAVGWVKDAKVVRLLPDTLVIAVEQRTPLAVWQHRGATKVIDSEGVLIPEADPARFGALPLVVGEGADQAAAEVIELVRARPRLTERLEALVRVDTRRWDLRLKDGSLIQLPATDADAALIQLDQLDQRARVLELGFARIDLRDPEMIAVRPRDLRAASQPAYGGA
jgi:cell division protein FtsQ